MCASYSPKAVGITGGIGCGKTTVVSAFAELGVPAFVADRVAARYYDSPDFCHAVAQTLGADVLATPDTVDKVRLAQRVFSDPEALTALNTLVHPRVMADFERWLPQQRSPYALFESAILYECGLDARMDATIVVYLDRAERMRRLLLRDRVPEERIEARMARQLPSEVLLEKADYVILNYEGNPRARQVDCVHRQILSRL
ncbi:MAG: dephospho-CoA kinase [bacterium P3]|nr:MAG: dephospho-CoA kinase [bacterium P3]KWW41915.1 MAG: dephospho-CoA kinase [bacterium F083]